MASPIAPEGLPLLFAGGAAASLAILAWRLGTLDRAAAAAAALLGTMILWGTGITGAVLLALFFVTGTSAGRLFPLAGAGLEFKVTRRTATQVWANGGAAAIGGLIALARPDLGLWILTAGLAAATADTWATEVGTALGGPPRDLLSMSKVLPGASGGVTRWGTLAGLAGAVVIAAPAGLMVGSRLLIFVGTVLGFTGMLADSVLGSGWQAGTTCRVCGASGEASRHCGTATEHHTGVAWITNDTVNALATAMAALGGGLAWWLAVS